MEKQASQDVGFEEKNSLCIYLSLSPLLRLATALDDFLVLTNCVGHITSARGGGGCRANADN